ncbi:Aspartyl protease [bacterium A37T11]|nr:Aspartyl protease [bacterium A37T11]
MIVIPLIMLNLDGDGFHLLLEVAVFGKKFKAVLDTGASKSVFDKHTIETHFNPDELKATDRVSSGLGTTNMQSFVLKIPDLQIGDLHLQDWEIAVLDLSSINYTYEKMSLEPVLGVVGGDILTEYGGIINYRDHTLSLEKLK